MFPVKLDVGLKDLDEPTYKVKLHYLLTCPLLLLLLPCSIYVSRQVTSKLDVGLKDLDEPTYKVKLHHLLTPLLLLLLLPCSVHVSC
jgi:hypothetical protein